MTDPNNLKEAALVEYLDECTEMLERFSKNLALVESASTPELLASIYRDMHTVKGSSQLFGFKQVSDLAHAMETCLEPVRKGHAKSNGIMIDCMYAGCDIIAALLAGIREQKKEPDLSEKIKVLLPRLIEVADKLAAGSSASHEGTDSEKQAVAASSPATPPMTSAVSPSQVLPLSPSASVKKPEEHPGFEIFEDSPPPVHLKALPTPPSVKAEVPTGAGKAAALPSVTSTPKTPDSSSAKPAVEDAQAETIRVQVTLLDSLMNLVGELVLIRNQLWQHAKLNNSDAEFLKMSQRLNIVTTELQNEVMKTRMQPIGNVLSKFTRVVRDLGRELGKKIDLSIQGAETELDKTIIEAVKDPLTHIIRNSVDHGVETTADRRASGKSEIGHVTAKAYHENGQVIIEIADDGRGLDRMRIGNKAVEKGLITADALGKMRDRDVQFLIFAPGFSTAASVSNISGRGVGMDVVKTNIERIGGMVDIASVPGAGTTIKLKIPLTLAIVPALIVRALEHRFAIPQSKLVELVRIDRSEDCVDRIEVLQGSPVLRLRGRILPLLSLSEILRKTRKMPEGAQNSPASPTGEDSINIAILNADGYQFGLIVDSIDDTADIVVKALAPFLKDLAHFSGASIMGDGAVALVLDVMGISTAGRLNGKGDSSQASFESGVLQKSRHYSDMSEFLLVDVGAPGSYAIPLTVVSRLEEFDRLSFEFSGSQKVVRYRDALLPIFSLPDFLNLSFGKKREETEKAEVVVIRRGDNLYGIEVFGIQDVVAIPSQIDQTVRDRPGILGSMVANDRVIVVVDVLGMIDTLKVKLISDSGHNDEEESTGQNSSSKAARQNCRILLAEDSSFFRSYVRRVLDEAGFVTETACDGQDAWNILDAAAPGHFSIVLSDIEMPNMDGLQLARKIIADGRFSEVPLVAITTRFSNTDIEKGQQAGFTRYMEKLNAEKLIAQLDELNKHPKHSSGSELKHANAH